MSKLILLCCLISLAATAQENQGIFNFIFSPGIGLNKSITYTDGNNPYIPTNSELGLNLTSYVLIEYNRYSKINFSTGIGIQFNQLNYTIRGIITGETITKRWNPVEIKESYTNTYLSIPLFIHYTMTKLINIGFGISYDYLIGSKTTKVVTNNTDPEVGKISNTFYPGNYSLLMNYKYALSSNLSIVSTLSLRPNKTISLISSNSTGSTISGDIHFEIKL